MSTIKAEEPVDVPVAQRALAEAFGTFVLVFLGCGGAIALAPAGDNVAGTVGTALSFGFGIAGAIYATGHISGGHLNPAVSVALAAIGRFRTADLPWYIGAQLIGAIFAAAILKLVYPDADSLGNNALADGVSSGSGLVLEAILTAIFVFVIVAVATDRRVTPGFAALAIGLTLAAVHLVAIPVTGTSVNPARTIGPDLLTGDFDALWIFLLGPFVGAVVGAGAYGLVRPDRALDDPRERRPRVRDDDGARGNGSGAVAGDGLGEPRRRPRRPRV